MSSVQNAVFPGFILGSLFVISTSFWMGNVTDVPINNLLAATEKVDQSNETSEEMAITPSEPESQETGCGLSPSYPQTIMQWCELITRHAQEQGLDPNLIAAIILQESNGNPQAYSNSGAVGLMQVMPNDGIAAGFWCSSGPCFAGRPSTNELLDPEFNIAYGTRMIGGLVQKHGNVREALRAYGPIGWEYEYADKVLAIYNQYR